MFRTIWVIGLSLILGIIIIHAHAPLLAKDTTQHELRLNLQCSISFSNYDQIAHSSKTVNVTLTNVKHKPGGMLMLTQTEDYEFWVMTHSVQTLNDQRFINNFQVAIKHKASQLFMHALSDSTYHVNASPQKARISLVQYYPDSFLEKGELFLECRQLD